VYNWIMAVRRRVHEDGGFSMTGQDFDRALKQFLGPLAILNMAHDPGFSLPPDRQIRRFLPGSGDSGGANEPSKARALQYSELLWVPIAGSERAAFRTVKHPKEKNSWKPK
jgi:hypothetical protein